MKGNNEITINQATMIEAIQHYFESIVFRDTRVPTVKSVEAVSGGSAYGSDKGFVVKIEAKPDSGMNAA